MYNTDQVYPWRDREARTEKEKKETRPYLGHKKAVGGCKLPRADREARAFLQFDGVKFEGAGRVMF